MRRSLVVLFLFAHVYLCVCGEDVIGEGSDDNFEPPPLANSTIDEAKKKAITLPTTNVKESSVVEKKKETEVKSPSPDKIDSKDETKKKEEVPDVSPKIKGIHNKANEVKKKEESINTTIEQGETTVEATTTVEVKKVEEKKEKNELEEDDEEEGKSDEEREEEEKKVEIVEENVVDIKENEKKDGGDGDEEGKKEANKEIKEDENKENITFKNELKPEQYSSDSHFFSYFLFFLIISASAYLGYHNKRKIMALVLEGRSSHSGRGVRYHRLAANDENFERNVIY